MLQKVEQGESDNKQSDKNQTIKTAFPFWKAVFLLLKYWLMRDKIFTKKQYFRIKDERSLP